jgi:2-dehydro-3-deoxyglucarate aldolase/4-hydroxy-2-oxoheptanedioate aldolase
MTETLQTRLRDDEPVTGYWTTLADPAVPELVAETGVDFVVVDTEHTPSSLETVANSLRAVDAASTEAAGVVRVPWNDQVTIKRVLDLDPAGVMAPMVSTPEEATEFVAATRYPPRGVRGIGVGRSAGYGRNVAGQVERDDADLVRVAQIETEPGVKNVGEIAAVEGLDALFVGPADLSAALGSFGDHGDAFEDAVSRVLDAGSERDVPVGTLATGTEDIERWVEWGFDYVICGVDTLDLVRGADAALAAHEAARE